MKKSIIFILIFQVTGLYSSPTDIMADASGYGFGGAYCAISEGPSSVYWNPSGIAATKYLSVMENNWILQDVRDINVNFIIITVPIPKIGVASGSWMMTKANLEEGWNENTNGALSTSSAYENIFSLSFSRQLWDELLIFSQTSVGLNINRFTLIAENGGGAGLGFDIGIRTNFPLGFCFGFTAKNLATEIMDAKVDPELRLGIGYNYLIKNMHRIKVGLDALIKKNRDYKKYSNLEPAQYNKKAFGGLEYSLVLEKFSISVRGGANQSLYDTYNRINYAFGIGVNILGHSIDYAFSDATDTDFSIGKGHRISLLLSIGKFFENK